MNLIFLVGEEAGEVGGKGSKGHFSRSKRSNLALFAFGGHLLQNCSVTFSLFWHRAAKEGY